MSKHKQNQGIPAKLPAAVQRRITVASIIKYLDTLNLPNALFWFIENDPKDTAVFFYLRERVRKGE